MIKLIKTQLVILSSLLTAFALTLAACGGGGSSAGAGGGGTTVVGSIKSGVAAIDPGMLKPAQLSGPLVAVGNLLVPEAEAAVYSVTLVCEGGFNSTQDTDASGKFVFSGAGLSGMCTVTVGTTVVGQFAVVDGAENEVEINAAGGNFTIVKTESKPGNTTTVEVEVEDEKSNDQASNDQQSNGSDDQSSSDQKSSDQASSDQPSEDRNPG